MRQGGLLQVDMQYPRRAKGQSSSDEPRPSFSQVLLASLRAESETRAWFNEELKYQYVRQTRTPLALPQVLLAAQPPGRQISETTSGCSPAFQGGNAESSAPEAHECSEQGCGLHSGSNHGIWYDSGRQEKASWMRDYV